jgi:hypothetical protein
VVEQALRTALAGASSLPRLVAQDGWARPWGGPEAIDLAPSLDPGQVTLQTVALAEPQEEGPLFTMVVPSVRRPGRLEAMLASAKASLGDLPWELIGICPREDQATREVFQRMGARMVLADEDHRNDEGEFSWSVLMNAGFAQARGKWVMYGSDDLIFERESLPRLLAYGEMAGTRVGGVAMMEHNPESEGYPEWWAPMGADGWLMINFGVVRRAAWEAVGGFFPGYHFYGADWDLCYLLHAAGWEILPAWDALTRHQQEGDPIKRLHEGRWQDDKFLLDSRSHLRPKPQTPPSSRVKVLHREGARLFAMKAVHNQLASQWTRHAGRFLGRLERWVALAPEAGALFAMKAKVLALAGAGPAEILEADARARELGWEVDKEGSEPRQAARCTVLCAVWHKDPHRLDLLRGHQACLDAQTVAVDRIYVFDGGDTPPDWLKGTVLVSREPLKIYEAWNLACAQARSPYVMNLNLDDRLNPDGVEIYLKALDSGLDLVGGDWRICHSQQETDDVGPSQRAQELEFDPAWPPTGRQGIRLGSGTGERGTLGPATAWRTSLHQELGRYPFAFNDGSPVTIIGDALWWQRVIDAGKRVLRLPFVVGRYHSHPGDQAEFRSPAAEEAEKAQETGVIL